jgi:D-glycero-alpha-D-manno-heptose-7-phosphate kinase
LIVVKSPFRVSFAGGFSDAAARERGGEGAVLSAAVGLHAYITAQLRKDAFTVAAYSRVERVDQLENMENALFREAIAASGVRAPLEMHSIGVLSLASSGLGGSSSAAVGMVLALSALRGARMSARVLAEAAADVEINKMKRSIGKQDHYAAAYGGLNVFKFRGEYVEVQRMDASLAGVLKGCMAMTPCHADPRDASEMLKEQLNADPGIPKALADLVPATVKAFNDSSLHDLCSILREGWRLKKALSPRMSNAAANAAVSMAESMGGAGKLCGAGGSGHAWVILPKGAMLDYLYKVPGSFQVAFEPVGASVVHDDGERTT